MNEETNGRLTRIKDEALATIVEVEAAIESGEDRRQLDAFHKVQDIARRYAEAAAAVDESERERVDRTVGRRVTDLRRAAEGLTKRVGGTKVERSVDAGHVPFLERRAPPRSIEPARAAPTRHTPRFRVGGEVEAWCGKCREFTEHHIVAMVDEGPKQVICAKCNSRHSYRTEPTARTLPEKTATPATPVSTYRAPVDPEAARRAAQKRQLISDLDAAVDPRTFDPRGRYKANEIIVHPEFGRGKIENVLKGSLLVRFRDGLKPLNLK